MQGTVATYDAQTRAGTVLLDDGVVVPFAPGTPRADVRHLRPGQRVHLVVDPSGGDRLVVTEVSIH